MEEPKEPPEKNISGKIILIILVFLFVLAASSLWLFWYYSPYAVKNKPFPFLRKSEKIKLGLWSRTQNTVCFYPSIFHNPSPSLLQKIKLKKEKSYFQC